MRDRLISRWVNGVHIRQMFKCSAQMLRLQTGLYCKLDGAKPQSILCSQISRELGVYTKNTINSFLEKWEQLKGDEGISNLNHQHCTSSLVSLSLYEKKIHKFCPTLSFLFLENQDFLNGASPKYQLHCLKWISSPAHLTCRDEVTHEFGQFSEVSKDGP